MSTGSKRAASTVEQTSILHLLQYSNKSVGKTSQLCWHLAKKNEKKKWQKKDNI
jgi:hypothetical protein